LIKKFFIILILFLFTAFFCVEISYAEEIKQTKKTAGAAATKNESVATPIKGSAVINLNSDQMEYFEDKDQIVATGNVKIRVEDQNTVLQADKVTYDREADLIIAESNVKLIKNKQVIHGDYTRIDLIRSSILIDHPNIDISQLKIEAKTAKIYPKKEGSSKNNTDVSQGAATINDQSLSFILSSSGSKFINNKDVIKNPASKESATRFKPTYNMHTKKILVTRNKDGDIITLLNSTVKVNRYKIAYIPSLTITKDSETGEMETNLPEIAQRPDFGWYYGYGRVFNLPNGATLKAVPLLTNNSGLGIGGLARLKTDTNKTLMLYSSKGNKFVAEGEQKLPFSETTKIQYGIDSYIDNGFMWKQKHKKIIEVVDNRKLFTTDTFDFDLRSSAAYIEADPHWGTGRYQIQGDFHNTVPLLKLGKHIDIGESSQFNVAVYGNGKTYGVLRAGPTVTLNLSPLNVWLAYYQGGIYGETPFAADRYYYGKSNVTFNSSYKLHRFVSVGYTGSLNLSKDNWDNKLVAENQIYCWFGPDDLKFRISYDTKREESRFDFNMVLGADRSKLDFDKMKIIEN